MEWIENPLIVGDADQPTEDTEGQGRPQPAGPTYGLGEERWTLRHWA